MNRLAFYMVILLCVWSVPAQARGGDLIDQELSVRLDPAAHRLEARATLTRASGQSAWPKIYHLAAHAEIQSVTAGGYAVPFVFAGGRLLIAVQDGAADLTIHYAVRFDDPVPQDQVGIEDPSYGVTATIMPQGTFLSAASAWHPRIEGSKSRFKVSISGPPGVTGVTAGRLTEYRTSGTGTLTAWQTRLPQSALTLAAGEYQLLRDDLGEIQVLVFMSGVNVGLAAGYLESCRKYLALYQELFGPYPYAKFAVVENFYPTGYGLPGWTLLGSSVIRLPFIRTTSLPHEIAHAWWGNAIEIDYASGNWGEGLATYVADYYLLERNAAQEALEYRRKILRDYAALAADDDDLALSGFRSRMSKRDQAVGYGKAAMVFHMLRELVGDDAFWAGLQSTAREGRGKRYGWRDLQRHFETTAQRDLAVFFRQWIERPGAPQLSLSAVEVSRRNAGWQVSGTIEQEEPAYELAVPLRLITTAGSYEQVIAQASAQKRFVFIVADHPVSLAVDPDSRVFRKLYPQEVPATVNDLRASQQRLVVVAKGAEALLDASRDLLRGLQWHQAEVITEADYQSQRPPGRDLLILGWPEDPDLQPGFAQLPETAMQHVPPGDRMSVAAEDVYFMVRKSEQRDHVIAHFLPGSPAAAMDAARRISHYGRYSYLVFRAGQNQVKTTWEAADSPLRIVLEKDDAP